MGESDTSDRLQFKAVSLKSDKDAALSLSRRTQLISMTYYSDAVGVDSAL